MIDPVDRDFNRYSRALDAEAAKEVYLEKLEEAIKTDPEEKARLALLYAEAHEDKIPEKSFFEWARERLFDESTPAFTEAWENRPTNAEYWNWNDERV